MSATVKQMLEAANAAVPRITPAQAREMIAKGNTLVVDVRDPPEVQQSGKVAGATPSNEIEPDELAAIGISLHAQSPRAGECCAELGRCRLTGSLPVPVSDHTRRP